MNPDVCLRPIPYPYRAMLAICSDLDETPDRRVYRNTMRFLNTTRATAMGEGLRPGSRQHHLLRHAFRPVRVLEHGRGGTGDGPRADPQRAHRLPALLWRPGDDAAARGGAGGAGRHDCRLEVWIDHATAPTNFGARHHAGPRRRAGAPGIPRGPDDRLRGSRTSGAAA